MARLAAVLLVSLAVFVGLTGAQEPSKEAQAKQLREEIAVLKEKLSQLEKKLAALEGSSEVKKYIGPVRDVGKKTVYTLDVGERGQFGDWNYRIDSLSDATYARLSIAGGRFYFLVKGADTKGMVDGQFVKMPGTWEVTGTKRHLGATLHVVEPKPSGKLVRVK